MSWPLSKRVAAAAAVAGRDVEVAVGPELELAAVVVGVWRVADREDRLADRRAFRRRRDGRSRRGRRLRARRPRASRCRRRRSGRVRVEVGRRRDREQAALAFAAADQRGEVGEEPRPRPSPTSTTVPFPLDDEEAIGLRGVGGDEDRLVEVADRLERRAAPRRTPQAEGEDDGDRSRDEPAQQISFVDRAQPLPRHGSLADPGVADLRRIGQVEVRCRSGGRPGRRA